MSTTVREAAPSSASETPLLEWALMIVHHEDASLLGLRRVLPNRTALELGRDSGALGEGSLEDPLVSRKHARLEVDASGRLQVCDLGSANGTWRNGARVAVATCEEGDVLRLGGVLLSVQRAPEAYPLVRSPRAPVLCWSTARFLLALRSALERPGLLLVSAPTLAAVEPYLQRGAEDLASTGGERLQRVELAPRELRRGQLAVLPCADLAALESALELHPLLARAGARCVAVLERAAQHSNEDRTREQVLRFPSLAERREELPWLARAALRDALGTESPRLGHALALRLLRGSWPEDVAGLERWARTAAPRAAQGVLLEASGDDLRFTGESVASAALEDSPPALSGEAPAALRLSRHGTWFCLPGARAVDLRMRFALARVLRALVASYERSPEEALSIDALVEAGWPGEKLLGDSGTNRLYVAVGTLRKLGLRELLERREGGYRLSPASHAEVSPAEAPPAEPLP